MEIVRWNYYVVKEKIICSRRQIERVCTMKKIDISSVAIADDDLVTVIEAGKHTTITHLRHRNTAARTRKLSKDLYCDNEGVVQEYKHTENRQQSIKSVRKSLNKLCDIINANTTDLSRCRFVTLTYAENMTDLDKLDQDWENFRKKVRRKWGDFEYVKITEPQGRGAWHLHIIMIFGDKAPYISNNDLYKVWGKGYVSVKSMGGVDFGKYFTMSLRDMSVSEADKAEIKTDGKKLSRNKQYIKGARLELYPSGIRIYNCSKGIVRPKKKTMTKTQADSLVKDMKEIGGYSQTITNSEGRCINKISIKNYIAD